MGLQVTPEEEDKFCGSFKQNLTHFKEDLRDDFWEVLNASGRQDPAIAIATCVTQAFLLQNRIQPNRHRRITEELIDWKYRNHKIKYILPYSEIVRTIQDKVTGPGVPAQT